MRTIERLRTGLLAVIAITLLPTAAMAQDYDDGAPDEEFVWEDGYEVDDGEAVDGYYRVKTRPGHKWVTGHYDGGRWVPPHWKPVAPQAGFVWVPGHRGPDGYWVSGHWRKTARDGMVWVAPRRDGKRWRHGHWKPAKARPDHVWVAGHRGPKGRWIPGHFRKVKRGGHAWVPGHWRYGRWVPGHWRPQAAKANHVWVPGYRGPKGWVAGMWRPAKRAGSHWRAGHWGPRGWVRGGWAKGPRKAVKRRHARVKHARHVAKERRGRRALWREGKRQEVRGKRQEHRGERLEKRGKRVERRGEATGNKRLEKKGERMQKKGERKQRKGERKQNRGKRKQKRAKR